MITLVFIVYSINSKFNCTKNVNISMNVGEDYYRLKKNLRDILYL